MIRITSQCSRHQYDSEGREITTWDIKKCAWIVNSEFENENIDWYGNDSDFPGGYTLAEYEKSYPNWNKNPNIIVTWTWNSKESYLKTFKELPKKQTDFYKTSGHLFQACDMRHAYEVDKNFKYPYSASRDWGYLDYSEEVAIEQLGKYCKFYEFADNTKVIYNDEIIFDGKLE